MTQILELTNVSKSFRGCVVLDRVNLELFEGEFLTLFGPSSSGKSTMLRIIMGLEQTDGGSITLRGENAAVLSPAQRMIGYVPQSFALFPDKAVFENIAYPLTFTETDDEKIKKLVDAMAEGLHISHLLEKMPVQLSGGEKQRVAIARGLVKKCNLYILDDPLAGLDFKLREKLIGDLRYLKESIHASIFYATSDPMEAMALSDRVLVLDAGGIQDSGAPKDVYFSPAHLSSMAFFGFPEVNLLGASLRDCESTVCTLDAGIFKIDLQLERSLSAPADGVTVGIRPESIKLCEAGKLNNDSVLRLEGRLVLIEDLGSEMIVHVEVRDRNFRVMVRHDEGQFAMGEVVSLEIPYDKILAFDENSRHFVGRGKGKIDE